MTDNFYKPPKANLRDFSESLEAERLDQIKVLASGFQMTLYASYILLASIAIISTGFWEPFGLIGFVLGGVILMFGVIIVGIGEKNSFLLGLLYLLVCIIPVLNIISIFVILKRTANQLKQNSYRIEIWGAMKKPDDHGSLSSN